MKLRILILPISAALIASLVMWRVHRESLQQSRPRSNTMSRQLAPRFELYDQHSRLVKFERYLGRTRVLLLFAGRTPIAEHPLVRKLVVNHPAIDAAGVQVVVVNVSTPYAFRHAQDQLGAPFPFPVLADFDQFSPAPTHQRWGLAGDDPAEVRDGLFLIDRDGTVAWSQGAPRQVDSPDQTIEAIVRGLSPR